MRNQVFDPINRNPKKNKEIFKLLKQDNSEIVTEKLIISFK